MSSEVKLPKLPDAACTGCGGCRNICPKDAIVLKPDHEGFLMPSVDAAKCIGCGACERACPALNYTSESTGKPEIYAIRANNKVRSISSSGGVFQLLARPFILKGGAVFGAAFDKELKLRHRMAVTEAELGPLRGSKYLQSDTGLIYRKVQECLKKGQKVLFVGTPCQIAALKNIIKDTTNLYTLDLLCHGVPSQQVFDKYLEGVANGKKVKAVKFRSKRFGWTANRILVEFEDGSNYVGDSNDTFEKMFLKNFCLRKSCSDCPFSEYAQRPGDLSIGDFWGISKVDKSCNDGKGTSMVLVNNAKGQELLEMIYAEKNRVLEVKKMDLDYTILPNRLKALYASNKNRDRFLKLVQRLPAKTALARSVTNRCDIGLVSNYYAGNFGGSLTQYALYHVLEDMGYNVLMIERPKTSRDKTSMETLKMIYKEVPYPAEALAPQYDTRDDMRVLNDRCDMFVVGSDQLFQYGLYQALDKFIGLDWAADYKKKIAYAGSFGHDFIWGDDKLLAEMAYFMRKFDAFSVREESGVDICRDSYGIDAEWVLDPVFLVDRKHYDALIEKSDRELPERYIGSYILDPSEEKKEILSYAMEHTGMPAEIYSELGYHPDYIKPLEGLNVIQLKVEERLQSIANCDLFVTDSFHGTCFAIITKRPFVSILNSKRGASRFYSLLSMFGLEDRLITSLDDLKDRPELFEPIDFTAVYEVLDRERERCMNWLKTQLQAEKQIRAFSDYDALMERYMQQEKKLHAMSRCLQILMKDSGKFISTIEDIHEYLRQLAKNKQRYLIAVSVKDTPGFCIDETIAQELKELGLKISLQDKHWHSYLGVLDCGKLLEEKLSKEQEAVSFAKRVGGKELRVVSKSFRGGNLASIVYEKQEYSCNRRGLNIFVYDRENGCPIDSVCFDTHSRKLECYRNDDIL
ncbi:MAG: Coenzyme F420 hydrogenase/dehydrogenase, beta subunit C-terminal domain [Ruminococcus sp.]|nr:Coenzyme F420 hydrogenase/dehydrogenase, beta subunit C-terminal domain [Oscillospiraceae bacterium]MBQ8686939.1 Coenzyme F420 hydrogenase/dehydrogenase, beta subunit C-terminal domain [Ruminococcus sp.]